MTKQTIGDFLATLRKANGYTQQEVADRLGISNRTLSGWECDKVLPDILLLPALAELYGVTVDEILSGERKEKGMIELTGKSERNLVRNRLSRFGFQTNILIGLMIIGTLIILVGFFTYLIMFFLGLVTVLVSVSVILALWRAAETAVDDEMDCYSTYRLLLRRKMTVCLYVLSVMVILAQILFALYCLSQFDELVGAGVISLILILFSIAVFVCGWFVYSDALKKWGDERVQTRAKQGNRFIKLVALIGLIPIVLSIAAAIVVNCVDFTETTTVYQNDNLDEFVEYMETLEDGFNQPKHFPLSEFAKDAQIGEEFDLGDGYIAVFDGYTFTVRNDEYKFLEVDSSEVIVKKWSVQIQRFVFIDDEGISCSFYNVRYWYNFEENSKNNKPSPYKVNNYYTMQDFGNGMAYVHVVERDYSFIGYIAAAAVIEADILVCACLCVWKRYIYKVKL